MEQPWLETLHHLTDRGLGGALITVIGVEGSTPRGPGARMIVTANGAYGTIGGGRLELDAIAAARDALAVGAPPAVRRIRLGPTLGQCCGGAVTLLVEPVTAPTWAAAIQAALLEGRPCVVATVVDSPAAGVPVGARLVVAGCDLAGTWRAPAVEAAARRAALDLLASGGRAETTTVAGHTLFLERHAPDQTIVLFGAGHVGRALVTVLGTLPCTVRWIDDRTEQFPSTPPRNVRVEATDASELAVDDAPAGACFVVMTHDHQRDLAIVERVLRRGDFAYLGMIGSVAKRRRFEQRLHARGIAPEVIARLRCPIGLAGIPGKHPGAIAVAVAAELLQV